MTLKLWADERTDGTQACCSPEAVRGARALAHSLGIPHLTLDLEEAFRREVVDAFVDGYRAGETPNPCVICNGDLRIDAMVALADRLGASQLGDRPLRPDRGRRRRPAARRCRRRGEGPDLHALRPAPGDPGAAAVPAGRPDQARGASARGSRRARRRREAREPGPLLPRRRGQALVPRAPRRACRPARRGRRRRRRRARRAPGPPPLHGRAAPRPRGRERRAALRPRHRRGLEPGDRRPPRRAGSDLGAAPRRPPPSRLRARRPRQAPLPRALDPVPRLAGAAGRAPRVVTRAGRARLRRRARSDRVPARRRPGRRPGNHRLARPPFGGPRLTVA